MTKQIDVGHPVLHCPQQQRHCCLILIFGPPIYNIIYFCHSCVARSLLLIMQVSSCSYFFVWYLLTTYSTGVRDGARQWWPMDEQKISPVRDFHLFTSVLWKSVRPVRIPVLNVAHGSVQKRWRKIRVGGGAANGHRKIEAELTVVHVVNW